MNILEQQNTLEQLLMHQLNHYWTDIDETVISSALPGAIRAIEKGFTGLPNQRFYDRGKVRFSPYISVQWTIFLYRIAHEIYKGGQVRTPKEADQVYYLNKILHANDWFYAVELPEHFLCEHPLGSVLGRAQYGEYLFVYQGTTVGGNRRKDEIYYPILGNNVILFANSTILGDTHIGNNVVVAANTYMINAEIPDNCIVFGKSPDL